jgi:UPF0042 nucleotide-binding protein
MNQPVVDYIDAEGDLTAFLEVLNPLLDHMLPRYLAEGKNHLVVAVGCTGGHHRSVAIVEALAKRYSETEGLLVDAHHRDADRPH